jgi:hypothetical protein
MNGQVVEQAFDTTDANNTVRITRQAQALLNETETELQRAQSDALRYRQQRDQQLLLVRLQCEEICQIKALQRTLEKENVLYKTLVENLMHEIELLAPTGKEG